MFLKQEFKQHYVAYITIIMTSIESTEPVLSKEQQKVYDACTQGTSSIFCTGQGGTGKSLLLSSIVKFLKNVPNTKPESVAITASTGVAAYHIHGITLHRFSGTGIEESDLELMIQKASKPRAKNQWLRTRILIIDEVSMLSATLFDNLSALAKHLRQSEEPFGGIRSSNI
jgi:ATP-dependent DNA helicase PIF1